MNVLSDGCSEMLGQAAEKEKQQRSCVSQNNCSEKFGKLPGKRSFRKSILVAAHQSVVLLRSGFRHRYFPRNF